jgi:hypothetical protein
MGMTSVYGATDYGRYQQLMESYFSIIVSKGMNVTDNTFINVSEFFKYLNPILIHWLETEHPRLLQLTKEIGAIKNLKDLQKVTLYSDTSTCIFAPKAFETYQYFKNKKRFTYRLYSDKANHEKLATALTANIIHFSDASLVHAYYRRLSSNLYYGFTVHDRFFMHVAQSYKLYSILQELYINFYKQDLFKRNFKGTRLYNVRVSPIKEPKEYLKESDLLNPKFVKM